MNTEEIKDVNIITTKNNKELEKRLKELSQELIEENYELYIYSWYTWEKRDMFQIYPITGSIQNMSRFSFNLRLVVQIIDLCK